MAARLSCCKLLQAPVVSPDAAITVQGGLEGEIIFSGECSNRVAAVFRIRAYACSGISSNKICTSYRSDTPPCQIESDANVTSGTRWKSTSIVVAKRYPAKQRW